ncbi:MAG: oligopeptide/dipeptide ABC transporter ATP-binding protein [Desulfovibrionaceae bacterium]
MPQPPVIQAHGLAKAFKSGLLVRRKTSAVREASLRIEPGRTLAVVGESGCGKTTLARMVAGLLAPDAGSVDFAGRDLAHWPRKQLRRKLQVVFQDADGSLNPNLTARDLLLEPLRLHGWPRRRAAERLPELMDMVGLTPDLLRRHPHEMSGGQRQRIGLARAMSLAPDLVVADEPVASLDRSVQAQILRLLKDLQESKGIACLYISHDLATVRALAHDVAVMLGGVFVETGPVEEVFSEPAHPYTRMLLEAVTGGGGQGKPAWDIEQGVATSLGCPLALACPYAEPACATSLPVLLSHGAQRGVRCKRTC